MKITIEADSGPFPSVYAVESGGFDVPDELWAEYEDACAVVDRCEKRFYEIKAEAEPG